MNDPTARSPWWLWPTRLSLDAPAVAVVWQRFLADAHGLTVSAAASASLGFVVWGVYLADRWFDTAPGRPTEYTDRHYFAGRNRKALGATAVVALVAAVGLAVTLPSEYLLVGSGVAVAVAAYFAAVFIAGPDRVPSGAKELAVGVLFAAGAAVPLAVERPDDWRWLPSAGEFASVCCINCAFISCWEAIGKVKCPPKRVVVISGAAAIWMSPFIPWPVAASVLASVTVLAWLDVQLDRISVSTRRVLADAALLTPLGFWIWT